MRRWFGLAALLLLAGCGSGTTAAPVAAPARAVEAAAPTPAEQTLGVTASTLNVRDSANGSANVLGQLQRGDHVTVLEKEGDWLRIRTAAGLVGWAAASYLGDDAAVAAAAHPSGGRRVKPSERRASDDPGCNSEYRFVKTPIPRFAESGAHGLVVIEATVDAKGDVQSTRIVSNRTGDPSLGKMAESELKTAKFQAPRRNCVARSFIFTYTRTF